MYSRWKSVCKYPSLYVLANKQDLPGVASPSEVAIIFSFDSMDTERVLVRGTSALTGEGIGEALMEL